MSRRPSHMNSLRSFVLSAPSESDLLLRRVLFGLFSPVIHNPDDFAKSFPSLGGSGLDMERVSWKDFSGEDTGFIQLSQADHECFWTDSCHRSLELSKAVIPLHNLMEQWNRPFLTEQAERCLCSIMPM